jgi:hypothetical protein
MAGAFILLDYVAAGIDFEIADRPGWMLPDAVKYTSALVLLAVLGFALLGRAKHVYADDQ